MLSQNLLRVLKSSFLTRVKVLSWILQNFDVTFNEWEFKQRLNYPKKTKNVEISRVTLFEQGTHFEWAGFFYSQNCQIGCNNWEISFWKEEVPLLIEFQNCSSSSY